MKILSQYPSVLVRQRKELAELLGFETRNKYEILDPSGKQIMFCAEMQKGFFGFFLRQILGHWRSFELHFFCPQKQMLWRAVHPFRFIFERLDIVHSSGSNMGVVEWKWGILTKRFQITNAQNNKTMNVQSGFFSFWTFPVTHQNLEVAKIQKKWSGVLKEMFTDTDNFLVEFSPSLDESERQMILSTAILTDLRFFERKAE